MNPAHVVFALASLAGAAGSFFVLRRVYPVRGTVTLGDAKAVTNERNQVIDVVNDSDFDSTEVVIEPDQDTGKESTFFTDRDSPGHLRQGILLPAGPVIRG